MIKDITIAQNLNIETSVTSDELKSIFAIVSDDSFSESQTVVQRRLIRYDFNQSDISTEFNNVSIKDSGLN